MGQPAEKPRRATYADLKAAPPNRIAEIIHGALRVQPRPASPHAQASSRLGMKLGGPFDLGDGGPGGWWILDEPELHFPIAGASGDIDVLVPDLAGWRRERMPRVPRAAFFTLAPDWVCEVLSPATALVDRDEKMPIYAREGVRWAWLVDPLDHLLDVHVRGDDGRFGPATRFKGKARVRAVPFDAIELDLSLLWLD